MRVTTENSYYVLWWSGSSLGKRDLLPASKNSNVYRCFLNINVKNVNNSEMYFASHLATSHLANHSTLSEPLLCIFLSYNPGLGVKWLKTNLSISGVVKYITWSK